MKLEYISLEHIEYGDRARKLYENMATFIDNVKRRGIICPIAVLDHGKSVAPRYRLLAGGRRLKAAEQLQMFTIPAHIYDHELTKTEMKAIELSENLHREDLSWAEAVLLKKQIHDLQVATFGKKVSRDPNSPGWSQTQTAEMLGESPANLSRDLKLAETLIIVPALGEAKDKAEASKMMKKVGTDIIKKKKVEVITKKQASTNVDDLHENITSNYILMPQREDPLETGFFEAAPKLQPNMIDVVEIDPPYAIDLHKTKKVETTPASISMRGYNEVEAAIYQQFLTQTFTESYRVLKNGGWLLVWFAVHPWFHVVVECLTATGFDFRATPAIWTKKAGQTQRPKLHLASAYESFIYARKGDATIKKEGRVNIFDFRPVAPQFKTHPTEKPIELMQEILSTFGEAGDRVLVPFLGSGNTLLAAANLGMNGFGYDLTEEYRNDFVIKTHADRPPNYRSYK